MLAATQNAMRHDMIVLHNIQLTQFVNQWRSRLWMKVFTNINESLKESFS